jgi:predicted dehydrogenase
MKNSRRTFIRKSAFGVAGISLATSGMSARSYGNILGSNNRLNLAIVGLGRRLSAFNESVSAKDKNIRLQYLCDVMESQRIKAGEGFTKLLGYTPSLEKDVRRIYADKSVDAIIDATPDHWHAPGTCYAVQAGKHVYVEKPCSHNPREGELLVAFQKKYGKVIQVGNQARSSSNVISTIKEIHNGIIGNPYKAIAYYSNGRGEVPVPRKAPVPKGLDWDLFQGPAPRKEYMHDTWDYNWHWYGWDYGTAESGNNMIHRLDLARWALQVDYPERVDVFAGKYHFPDDGWSMYDTMDATYIFPGNKIIKCDCKSRNNYTTYGSGAGTIIFGTEGSVHIAGSAIKYFDRSGKLIKENTSNENTVNSHMFNFYDCIRGNSIPNSPVTEAEKSTLLCHLANIAHRINKGFDVDSQNGQAFDRNAQKLWCREYEPGWEPKI